MENICNGQNQIQIILTWIVRAINKVIKKAIECLGNSIIFPKGLDSGRHNEYY